MSPLRCRFALASLALFVVVLAAPAASAVLPQRTFVASYGIDSNPCLLTSPCRGFDAAVTAVIPGGEVIALDSAGYGPTTITKSVSIIAPAGVYAGITAIAPGNLVGVTINAPGIKVVLQNLAINGLSGVAGTYGILLQQAAELDVNNCTISGFTDAGILATAANSRLSVRDTLIRDIHGLVGNGVALGASMRAVLERVRVVRNDGNGIRVAGTADASVKRSVVAGNGKSGVEVYANPGEFSAVTVEDSLIADNGGDGITSSSAAAASTATEVTAARNTITRNVGYGVSVTGTLPGVDVASLADNLISQQGLDGVWAVGNGAVITAGNNTFAGNGTSALHALAGATIHTVKGADGLPNNAGEQTTPTLGNVVPSNPF